MVAVICEDVEPSSRRNIRTGGWEENCEPHCSLFGDKGVLANY